MNSVVKSDSKYSAPKLVVYGDMAKLTASGNSGTGEGKGGGNAKKP
jgi:hypothetical protein